MPLRLWFRLVVVVAMGTGALCALFGPMIAHALSSVSAVPLPPPDSAEPAARLFWSSVALVRVLGTAVFALALVLWNLRGSLHVEMRPRVALSLAAALLLALGMSLGQQRAIWNGPAGAGIVLLLSALLLLGALSPRRAA